jgi:TatD DNase family protein
MNFAVYHDDIADVIERTKEDSVAVINIGTQADTSKRAVELAQSNDHLWAIVGLHPIHTTASFHDHDELGEQGDEFTSRGEVFDIDYYRELTTSSDRVVGIGECGLDYYRNTSETKEAQEQAFRAQLDLAVELDLPVMLHVRPSQGSFDAYYDVLEIIKEYKTKYPKLRGQAHFFAGDLNIAQQFIDLGFYISFTGVITFAKDYEMLVKEIPLNNILSETDAPYVSPAPFRGQRNEPSHVREVVKKIAELKDMSVVEVAEQIKKNVKELYGIEY